MPWSWEALEFWFVAGTTASSVVAGFVGRAIRRNARRIDAIEASHAESMEVHRAEARAAVREIEIQLEDKVERHDRAIAALQAAQITHDDLGRVYRRLDSVVESCSAMAGKLDAQQGQLGLVCEYLMKKGD